jgi:hypothetical protein
VAVSNRTRIEEILFEVLYRVAPEAKHRAMQALLCRGLAGKRQPKDAHWKNSFKAACRFFQQHLLNYGNCVSTPIQLMNWAVLNGIQNIYCEGVVPSSNRPCPAAWISEPDQHALLAAASMDGGYYLLRNRSDSHFAAESLRCLQPDCTSESNVVPKEISMIAAAQSCDPAKFAGQYV